MTTTRIVYAAFSVGALAVMFLAACGASGPPPGTPEALYADLGCAKCHGDQRQGQRSGPALNNLADRWTEESLVTYFKNPKAVMEENPRLKYMAEEYPIEMPAFRDTSEEALQQLAQFILSG